LDQSDVIVAIVFVPAHLCMVFGHTKHRRAGACARKYGCMRGIYGVRQTQQSCTWRWT
jgi:hypothetical protein